MPFSTSTPALSTNLGPPNVDWQLLEPGPSDIERRVSAIEERLAGEDAARRSWERLKLIGLVLAA